MRLVTYMGLVARRIWSKRGVLFGSLLGAMLVTSLLVIVPLYESSVQAVDLLFTLRGAPASEVDLVASAPTTDYDGAVATQNRELVTDLWQQDVVQWYPTLTERSQSRELAVIPIDGSVPWVSMAEDWQVEYDAAVADGLEGEDLPQPPYPQPPPEATQIRFFTAPDIADRLVVTEGVFPDTQRTIPPGEGTTPPLEIAIGTDLAATIDRGVGDVFVLKPFAGPPDSFELVEVVGVVDAADSADVIWGIDTPGSMVYVDQATWDAWSGPLAADATDPWRRDVRGFDSQTVNQRFIMQFDPATVTLEELPQLAAGVTGFRADVSRDSGGTIAASSFLDNILEAFTTRSVTVGAPILAVLALVVGGALYFLVYTAALTLEREGPEIALLKTRGASSWQTTGIHLGQSAVLAALAALLAPYVARAMVAVTGRIPPLSELTGGEPLEVAQVRSIVPFVIAGAVITFAAMGLAILPFARKRVLDLRSLASRPGGTSVWQRYNLDLFAIGLSVVILFQLSQRGFINVTEGEVELDPLAIVFPALLLFTGALILLRLLPWMLRFVGWVMTKRRSMSAALPGWHLGRNPVPYGRLALLVWLTTGLGAFALTYANTLETSFDDRAAYVSGADVRVLGEDVGWIPAPQDTVATGVIRTSGAPRGVVRQAEVMGVIPDEFSQIIHWRPDFGPPPDQVFGALRPDGERPDLGVELPEDATSLRLDGIVVPLTLAEQTTLGDNASDRGMRLMAKMFDAGGRLWTYQADEDLVDTEWRTVEMDLAVPLNTTYPSGPEPPFSVHVVWVETSNTTSGVRVNGEQVLVTSFDVVTPTGTEPFDPEEELLTANGIGRFRGESAKQAVETYWSDLPEGSDPPTTAEIEASPLNRDGDVTRWQLPAARTRASIDVPSFEAPDAPLKVVLEQPIAAAAGLAVGDESTYGLNGIIFDGELVGLIDEMPTAVDGTKEGTMVLDRDALLALTDGMATWSFSTALARINGPNELWVATDDEDATLRRLAPYFPPGEEPDAVFTLGGTSADFSSRPVQVGLVAILFVGAATSVVLALAGVTGYVLLAVARRAREMGVLRALGLQRREVATTFALEQVVVLGLGAFVGTLGGIALMWTMLPFLQLGETAEVVEPAIQLAVPVGALLGYIAIVAAVLILSVVWSTRRVSVRRMSEVLREVDR